MNPSRVSIEPFSSAADSALELVCIPYACGSANVFRDWPDRLPSWVAVSAVELPGRGRRILEEPFSAWKELTSAVTEALAAACRGPLVLFGHSMGALVAYEVARRAGECGGPRPSLLVASGSRPPDRARLRIGAGGSSDADLLDALGRLGAMPASVARDPELRRLILPGLRADFGLLRAYPAERRDPVDVPIVALGGRADPMVPAAELSGWERHTLGPCATVLLDGEHFFLHTHPAPFFAALVSILTEALDAPTQAPSLPSGSAAVDCGGWWL